METTGHYIYIYIYIFGGEAQYLLYNFLKERRAGNDCGWKREQNLAIQ